MASAFAALIGLGNPGPEHADTRHNAGFWFIDQVARQWSCVLRYEPKLLAVAGRARIEGQELWLLKPLTYMNVSGDALVRLCQYYKIEPQTVLVAHDELDLAPGVVRLKKAGGAGGHNGLSDIMAKLGADFWRLRLGIGRPVGRRDLVPYVLGRPSRPEQEAIDEAISRALGVLPDIVRGDTDGVMNLLHRARDETIDGT